MNYVERHLGDLIKDTVHLSMLEYGAYNLLLDMYYVKEAPLPKDKKNCYKLARAYTKVERDAVDFVLSEFFELTDFGYTHSRCDAEIEKYQNKLSKPNKKESQNARQQRSRERRAQLFEALRNCGVTLPWNTQIATLELELSRFKNKAVTLPVTRDFTAIQSPITSIIKKEKEKSNPQAVDNSTVEWWKDQNLIKQKMVEVGLKTIPGESWPQLVKRIRVKL